MAERGVERAAVVPEVAPVTAWLAGVLGWVLPGAGHFVAGRWIRGLVLGGTVWLMFILGLWLGGHLFPIWGPRDEGTALLLQIPPIIANIGAGALYLFCYVTNTGFLDQAKLSTYEYGNTFLLVAGLLNYLVALDAFDIAAGRKP